MENQLTELSSSEVWRYTSQIKLCEMGLEGQKKLKSASVAVVGAGGLGCASLLYLAAAGVGRVGIIDHDHIEMSNLQRQILYHQEDIGMSKCDVARKRLSLTNPHVVFNSIEAFLTTENSKGLLQDYDVVIDATDNFPARYAINDACLENSKPFIYGSIHHFEGQIAIFNALGTNGERSPDYRSLYPVPPIEGVMPSCAQGGVIAPLPGIIGSIQALEAIKLISEIGETLSGKLLKIDSLAWTTRLYQIGPCHDLHDNPLEISVEALKQMMLGNVELQFIDLREGSEDRLTNVDALCIPFSRLMDAPIQISDNKMTILVCHKGIRSVQAVKMLRERFNSQNIYSLKGGACNWSASPQDHMK